MKIQTSVKNSLKKIKEYNTQSKESQQNSWLKQEVSASLTLKASSSAPRLHQNYDYAMIKGNRTLKGLTAKFKGIVDETKPFYSLMHKNPDPKTFWGNEVNTCLTSQGFEYPKNSQKFQQLQINNKSTKSHLEQTPPKKLSKSLAKSIIL